MTEQEMLQKLAEQEKLIKQLTSTVETQENVISHYQDVTNAQAVNNLNLIRINQKYKKELTTIRQQLEKVSEYQNFLEILTGIYESNSHYDNIQSNMQISLTELTGRFKSRTALLFKKDEDGNFRIINTALQYTEQNEEKRDSGITQCIEEFTFNSEFPEIVDELSKSNEISPTIIDINNCYDLSTLCELHEIENMTVAPIFAKNELNYILAIVNPEKEVDHSLLSCIAIAYSNTVQRVRQQRLVEHLSITDDLTGLYDHTYFAQITEKLETEQRSNIGFIMIDLFRLKYVNDNFGHEAGDKYIYTVALILKKHFMDEGTFAFRLGGDEFAVITVDKDLTYINEKINAINEEIANTKFTDRLGTPFEARIDTGVDFTTELVNFTELKHNADIRMNDNKNQYYISHGLNRRK